MTTCQNNKSSAESSSSRFELDELGWHHSRNSKTPTQDWTLMTSRALAVFALLLAGYMTLEQKNQGILSLCACLIAVLFLVNAVIQNWHKQQFLSNPNDASVGLPVSSPLWSLALPLTVTLGASYIMAMHYLDKVEWWTQFRWNSIAVLSVIASVVFTLKTQRFDRPKLAGVLLGTCLGSSFAIFGLLMCHFIFNEATINPIELAICLVLPLMVCGFHLNSLKTLLLRIDRTKSLGAFLTTMLASAALCAAAIFPEARLATIAVGETMASSEDQQTSDLGFEIMKNQAAAPDLLKQINGDQVQSSMVLAMVPKNTELFSKFYFELTGKAVPTGKQIDTNSTDVNLGNTEVGNLRPGLSLQESQLTGHVDAKTLTSALYWTLVFNNQAEQNEEARCRIKLPTGAVVSRATLWINGKEQEAAFDTREKVQAAYQWIVKKNRDPLLITETKDGLVHLQAFPVPKWGEMKVRFGITAPLDPKTTKQFRLEPPRILSANFETADAPTNVKLESNASIAANLEGGKSTALNPGNVVLRGQFKLDNPSQRLQFNINSDTEFKTVTSRATHAEQNSFITESLNKVTEAPISLAVVMDGSKSVSQHRAEIERGLKSIPSSIRTKFFIANRHNPETPGSLADALGLLSKHDDMGCDDSKALEQAKAFVVKEHRGTILWLHGSQSYINEDDKARLRKLMMSGDHRLRIYDFQMDSDEPNQIKSYLQELDKDASPEFKTIFQSGSVENDLTDFASTSLRTGAVLQMVREKTHEANGQNVIYDFPVASRMSTLWAAEEARRLVTQGDSSAAGILGSVYRIVTPVTGAVVLETENDYQRNNLNRNMYGVVSDERLARNKASAPQVATSPQNEGVNDSNPGTRWDIRQNYFLRYPVAKPSRDDSNPATAFQIRQSYHQQHPFAKEAIAPWPTLAAASPAPSREVTLGDSVASQGAVSSGGGASFGDAYSSQGDVGVQNQNSDYDVIGSAQRFAQGFLPPTTYGATAGDSYYAQGDTAALSDASYGAPTKGIPMPDPITIFQAIAIIAGLWLVACGFLYKATSNKVSGKLLMGSALLLIGITIPNTLTTLSIIAKSIHIL